MYVSVLPCGQDAREFFPPLWRLQETVEPGTEHTRGLVCGHGERVSLSPLSVASCGVSRCLSPLKGPSIASLRRGLSSGMDGGFCQAFFSTLSGADHLVLF